MLGIIGLLIVHVFTPCFRARTGQDLQNPRLPEGIFYYTCIGINFLPIGTNAQMKLALPSPSRILEQDITSAFKRSPSVLYARMPNPYST